MKNIKIISLLLLLGLGTSCENFLDLEAISNVSENGFYKNAEEVSMGLTGCYHGMLTPIRQEWAVTELRSDNTRIVTNNSTNTGFVDLRSLDVGQVNVDNVNVKDYWDCVYSNINDCNKVINSMSVVTDEAQKKRLLGQALFIRAYHYFNLVRLFGGVFIVESKLTSDEANSMQRSNVDQVYALIERDLERIVDEDMLPASYDASEAGRISMVAAKTMLAKVYATHYRSGTPEYAQALPLLDQAITDLGNPATADDLVPYADIFDMSKRMNKEMVFAVRFKGDGYQTGSPFSNYFAPTNSATYVVSMGNTSGYNYPSDIILRTYDSQLDEVRSTVNYALGFQNQLSNEWIQTATSRYIKKYMNPVVKLVNGADADWPVIRVADVLLMYAEVDNEINGPTTRSINYVNMLRERAGISLLPNSKTSNRYDFRFAIQDERQLEFAFENHRWFDLVRTDMALDVMNRVINGKDEDFYDHFTTVVIRPWTRNDLLLPIPQQVRDINPNVPQNPGY